MPITPGCLLYRGELAVVPGRNEMYFWYVDGNDNDQGIWKTTDGGGSWTELNETGITSCGDLSGGCGTVRGTYNLDLAAVPDGQTTDLYAGAVNLYKCRITTRPRVAAAPRPTLSSISLTFSAVRLISAQPRTFMPTSMPCHSSRSTTTRRS